MIRIFLTGYMGAGKTTLGKALARELHIPFIDLDWYIEERFHKTVGELFSGSHIAGQKYTDHKQTAFSHKDRYLLREHRMTHMVTFRVLLQIWW